MPTDNRRWTDTDRDTVARTIHDHACPSDPDAGCNWTEDGTECRLTDFEGFADVVLDALTADGWGDIAPHRRRIAALEDLIVCYRTGKRPSKGLWRLLDETRAALEGDTDAD